MKAASPHGPSGRRFRIAFSFAGEKRDFVEKVARILALQFGESAILYDKFHEAEFARYDLGIYLPKFYREESDLVVAVFSADYDKKRWTGWEWMAIHAQLTKQEGSKVMLTRFNYANPDGLFENAAFAELDTKTEAEFAALILERLALNEGHAKDHYTKPAPPASPLKTDIPNNLPRLQPFFGREDELKRIATALDPKARGWGTLVDGDGGMGKTSLAVRAAFDCPPANFERIVFVSAKEHEQDDHGLRPLGGYAFPSWLQMLNKIAAELKLPDIAKAPEDQRALRLQEELASRRILLVLDNLETLQPAEQNELFNFLEFLPGGCKALLTSREFFGSRTLALDLKKLGRDAAMQMLGEIAEHNQEFAKSSEKDRGSLYDLTLGNALLMRWVAGQVGHGHCTTIADALDYLRSGPTGNDALKFVFGDVVTSLGVPDVRLLAALTWPSSPLPVDAIAEIADVPPVDCLLLLKKLANRSLVVSDQQEMAYALVAMVADFLRKKRPGVVAETGDRLEKRAYALIMENGYQKHDRFPALEAAWPGIAPALPLFLAGDNTRLQTVCNALLRFLDFQGRWDERLALCEKAEAKAVDSGDHATAGWRAYPAGMIHYLRRQADAVLSCADRAAAHWDRAKAGVRERAMAIRLRGIGHELKGDYPAAITAHRESLDLRRSLAAESGDVAIGLSDLADAERRSGDFNAAEGHYRETLRVARAVGHDEIVAGSIGNLAVLALDREDWPAAETLAREALPLSEAVHRQELIAANNDRLAEALVRQGKAAEALPHARRAVEIYTRLGSPDLAAAQATLAECERALAK